MNLYADCVAVKIWELIYVIGDGCKILHQIQNNQKEHITYSIGDLGVYK
jgi:hypothetical protein